MAADQERLVAAEVEQPARAACAARACKLAAIVTAAAAASALGITAVVLKAVPGASRLSRGGEAPVVELTAVAPIGYVYSHAGWFNGHKKLGDFDSDQACSEACSRTPGCEGFSRDYGGSRHCDGYGTTLEWSGAKTTWTRYTGGTNKAYRQEETYWVHDGCPKQGTAIVGGWKSSFGYLAGVRCCSLDGKQCTSPKKCPNANTPRQAKEVCQSEGKRLCTKNELKSNMCCSTGGNCDSYAIWTSTHISQRCTWEKTNWYFEKETGSSHNEAVAKERCISLPSCWGVRRKGGKWVTMDNGGAVLWGQESQKKRCR